MTLEIFADQITKAVEESIKAAMQSVNKRMEEKLLEIEANIQSIPKAEKGDKGDKGDSVTIDDIKPIIDKAVSEIEVRDGHSPSPESVAEALKGEFYKWALDFERNAVEVLEKATLKLRQPSDGKDAIELDNFQIELLDDGRTVKMTLEREGSPVERSIKIPAILDKGVYKENHPYEKGDAVTFGGQLWIGQKDAPEGKPGQSTDWRLAVKRGRDGREVVKIENQSKKVKVDG